MHPLSRVEHTTDRAHRPGRTAAEMDDALRAGRCSAVELATECLAAAAGIGAQLGAFVTLCPEPALDQARAADRRRARGLGRGPLDGVPVAIKDLQETAGVRTTYGCIRHRDHVPSVDAPAVARLNDAGAVIIGKTSTSPWGTLGETKHRLGPPACNPVDPTRTTGGSSGGSAAAVAAGVVPLATGTDCSGSITAPAALCGVLGVRPTSGLIANPAHEEGVLRSDAGILATSALDVALALDAMIGFDDEDPRSLRTPPLALADGVRRLAQSDERPLDGVRILVATDVGEFPADATVLDACLRTAETARHLGATVVHGSVPVPAPMPLCLALYATDMRRTFGLDPASYPEDLFEETHADLREAPAMTAEDYVDRLHELWRLRSSVDRLFDVHDLVLTPATAVTAFPHNEPPQVIGGRAVRPGWASFMPHSVIWNMSGNPTGSVPAGVDPDGLPIGCLVVARRLGEADILRLFCALGH